jgi:glycosyltransferase involved in cell wall biosynthesis
LVNIAFIINGAKPPRGGEFLTLHLITHLRRDIFHSVLIYAEEGIVVKEIKRLGIDAVHIPLSKKITSIYPRKIKLYNPFFILAFGWRLLTDGSIFRLKKLLKGHNIHLIYCADNLSKLIGGIVGKMTRIKVVAHCHDDFKEDSLGKIMRVFYLLLLDKILAVSEKVRKFFKIRERISQKVVTIYNGIDTRTYDPDKVDNSIITELGIKEKYLTIGNIGFMDKAKGQVYLLRAMEKLTADGITGISCIMCGTGPEKENLETFVKEKDLTKQVFFLDFRRDIPKILRILDILVIPSFLESFSMVAIEAMAMQVPVIATNIGGIPEVIDDAETGILIPPGDFEALVKAIKYLIENPQIRKEMGKKGRKKVLERFSIEENVRKTEEVFLNLLHDTHPYV